MVTAESLEPAAARRAGAAGERELLVGGEAGPAPGGRVAEALTGVFAPAAGAVAEVLGGEFLFAEFGGPAEFAPGARLPFGKEERFPIAARGVAEAGPDEVEKFVDEDAAALISAAAQGGVDDQQAPARVTCGVDGRAGAGAILEAAVRVAEVRAPLDADGITVNGREFVEQRG
jgi:hypothetical protein